VRIPTSRRTCFDLRVSIRGDDVMTACVPITRMDYDANGLRQEASRSRDAGAARRMLALALVLEGHSRTEAAGLCGMDRQTLRDWVHRYNEQGLSGLSNQMAPGATPRLSNEQTQEVARWVREGPSLAEHGVVRWRRIDLARLIQQRFGVHLAERSVGALLHRLGFRRLSARPRHPGHDTAAEAAHKKTSLTWSPRLSRQRLRASRSNCGGRTKLVSASKAL